MYLPKEEFDNLPSFKSNNSTIKKQGNTLYKNCYKTKELKTIPFLKTIIPKQGIILPKKLLFDEDFSLYGYTMPYIEDSINIKEFLENGYEIDTIKVIISMFELVTYLHKRMIIGDVRCANFLLQGENVYICDLEAGVKNRNNYSYLYVYYFITNEGQPLSFGHLADTIKTLLTALSLYYNYNFENLIKDGWDIMDILGLLESAKADPIFIGYLEALIRDINNKNKKPSLNFLELATDIEPPSEARKERLVRCLPSKYHS